jgi:hypothetical protein
MLPDYVKDVGVDGLLTVYVKGNPPDSVRTTHYPIIDIILYISVLYRAQLRDLPLSAVAAA